MNITEKEYKVLRSLITNDFDSGTVWADCINDSREPSGLSGSSLAGVVSSLSAKGLISCQDAGRDATVEITPSGYEAGEAK